MSKHEIRYASDPAGGYADPRTAPRRDRYYRCFDCGEHLHVRRGEVRRPYFAHYAERPVPCNAETIAHEAAKHRLVDLLLAGELSRISLNLPCSGFVDKDQESQPCPDEKLVERSLQPPTFDAARVEAPLGPYFIDAAATRGGEVTLALEVFHSHRVDAAKRGFLSQQGLAWCELHAADVLESDPPWRAITSSLGTVQCGACIGRQAQATREREALRKAEEQRRILARERAAYEARSVQVALNGNRVATVGKLPDGHQFSCLVCKKPVTVTTTKWGQVFMHEPGVSCDSRQAWVRAGMLLLYNQLKANPNVVKVIRRCSGYRCRHWFRDPLVAFDRVEGEEPCLVLYRERQPVLRLGFDQSYQPGGDVPYLSLRPSKLLSDATTLVQPKDGRLCKACHAKSVAVAVRYTPPVSGVSSGPNRIANDEPWTNQSVNQVIQGVAFAKMYFQAFNLDARRIAVNGIIVRKCEHCRNYGAFLNTLGMDAVPTELTGVLTFQPVKGLDGPGFLRNLCGHCGETVNNRHDLFARVGEAVYLKPEDFA